MKLTQFRLTWDAGKGAFGSGDFHTLKDAAAILNAIAIHYGGRYEIDARIFDTNNFCEVPDPWSVLEEFYGPEAKL